MNQKLNDPKDKSQKKCKIKTTKKNTKDHKQKIRKKKNKKWKR